MVREIRGYGTLVPVEIRWIPAATSGRVERILVNPGERVEEGQALMLLSNPEVQQAALDAESALRRAEAELERHRLDKLRELVVDAGIDASATKLVRGRPAEKLLE